MGQKAVYYTYDINLLFNISRLAKDIVNNRDKLYKLCSQDVRREVFRT